MRLFQVLDTPPNQRQAKLDEDLARFPHVNGDLFDGAVRIPDFDSEMRRALLDAGQFDWTDRPSGYIHGSSLSSASRTQP